MNRFGLNAKEVLLGLENNPFNVVYGKDGVKVTDVVTGEMELKLVVKNRAVDSKRILMAGDIDRCGFCTAKDSLLALQNSVDLINLKGDDLLVSDANLDGMYNAVDALLILKKSIS